MANHDTIREEILKYLSDWCEDYNNQRFDTLAAKYHQPDSIIIVPGRKEITYTEINKAWAEFYEKGWVTIEIMCDRFFITDHQVAVYNHAIGRDKEGKEVGKSRTGAWVEVKESNSRAGVVFQKRNGTWYSIMSAVVD